MKKSSVWKKILIYSVIAVVIAAIATGAYFLTVAIATPKSSYQWAMETIKKNYLYDFDEKAAQELFDGTETDEFKLKTVSAQMLDAYSTYYTAEEYNAIMQDNAGEKSGLGISYNFVEDEGVKLITVVGNSPAYNAGLRAGDVIVKYGYSGDETEIKKAEDFSKFIDARAKGEKFTVYTEEDAFEISKEIYSASYTFFATNTTAWSVSYPSGNQGFLVENPADSLTFLPEGFGYIKLNQFYGNAGAEFGKLVEKFNASKCTSLILDLRNNGGGYVSVMQDIAGYFVSSVKSGTNVAMTAKYKNGKKEVYNCVKKSGAQLVPKETEVYVLANSGTASASEALTGVLVSYDIVKYENIFISDFSQNYKDWYAVQGYGNLKTAQSYGKGIMQSTFYNNKTHEALKLTTAKIYWPQKDGNEKCIHDVGLTKDDGCTVVPNVEWTATRTDTELKYICDTYL